MALRSLNANDFKGCESLKKFTDETSGDMKKLMSFVGITLAQLWTAKRAMYLHDANHFFFSLNLSQHQDRLQLVQNFFVQIKGKINKFEEKSTITQQFL